MNLIGKTALVTGASRGIGLAVAQLLKSQGATVFVTSTSTDTSTAQGFARHFSVDFSDLDSTHRFCDELKTLPVDILINNAGINKISPFSDIAEEDFLKIQQVNVTAPFLTIQSILPAMKASGWGRIVNVTSIFGKVSREFRASYSASKFGLDGLTKSLALEVARYGILANCVAPGFVDTDLTREILGAQGIEELKSRIPLGRLARTHEIAELITWLASPINTYLCGQNLAIDGGFTIA